MTELDGIAGRVEAVRERIAKACARVGRSPAEVTLIAVSKTHGPEAVKAAWQSGVTDFGENRVQEALPKIEELEREFGAGARPAFHLIGHLQTNKARAAAGPFAILHGIDSERVLRAVSEQAAAPVRLMLQVNVSGEATKYGMTAEEVPAMVELARSLPRVELVGLMTIAPLGAEGNELREVFRGLRGMGENHGLKALSMGMTDDFEVAIEEGSTHVRVGRAIFGERSA